MRSGLLLPRIAALSPLDVGRCLLLCVLCAFAWNAPAAQMRFGPYTNFDGTLITNTVIIVQPVGDPAVDAAGNAAAMNGLPLRLTLGSDGMLTNTLQNQNYRITNALGGIVYFNKGYFFRAPLDSGPTIYSTTQAGVLISGQNYFVTLTLGTNAAAVTYNIITNALGGAPLYSTNLPALTNGHITLLEATNVSVYTANLTSNLLYTTLNPGLTRALTNAFATNAAGVSYANGRVYVSTNYDALGAALTASNNLLTYTLTLSNNLYTQITVGGITAVTATNISSNTVWSATNGYTSIVRSNAALFAGTNLVAITSNALYSAITVGGINAATATNINNALTGVVGTNGASLTLKFSATGTNAIQAIAQPISDTSSNAVLANAQTRINTSSNSVLANAQTAINTSSNSLAGNIAVKANTNNPVLFTPHFVGNTTLTNGNLTMSNGFFRAEMPDGMIWLLSNNTFRADSAAGVNMFYMRANAQLQEWFPQGGNPGAVDVHNDNGTVNIFSSGGAFIGVGNGSENNQVTISTDNGSLYVKDDKIIAGEFMHFEGDGSGITNVPVDALSTNGSTAGQVPTSIGGHTVWTNVTAIIPSALTNAYGTNAPTLLVTGQRLYIPTNAVTISNILAGVNATASNFLATLNATSSNFLFWNTVGKTNGFATGLQSTNTAFLGDLSFGRDGLSTNIISRTNYLAFVNAGSGIATNGAFIWDNARNLYTNWLTAAWLTNNGSAWLLKTNASGTLYSLSGTIPIGAYSATDGDFPAPKGVYTAAMNDHMILTGYFSITNANAVSNIIINYAATNASANYIANFGGYGTNTTLTNPALSFNTAIALNKVDNGGLLHFGALAAGQANTNLSSGYGAAVLSGATNRLNQDGAGVIAGGTFNTINGGSGNADAILGGGFNLITGSAGISSLDGDLIGGGVSNRIDTVSVGSVLAGGWRNRLLGNYNFLGGGASNLIFNASYSAIPGGASNYVGGNYSFAAGQNAVVLSNNAFAWSDGNSVTNATNNSVMFNTTNGFSINTNWAGTNALEVNGWVDSTKGFSVNGVPVTAGGGSGTVTSVNVAQNGYTSSGAVTTSGTITLTRAADVNNGGFAETNIAALQVAGGITNNALTASTVLKADANKKISSVANGAGVFTNDNAGGVGWLPVANLGGFPLGADGNASAFSVTNLWSTTWHSNQSGTHLIWKLAPGLAGPSAIGGPIDSLNLTATGDLLYTIFGANSLIATGNGFGGNFEGAVIALNAGVFSKMDSNKVVTGTITASNHVGAAYGLTNTVSYTHQGTTTNLTATFNGTLQSFTCTNGPSIGQHYFFHYAGANGSVSYRFSGSSYNNLHFDYQPKWLAGSNSVITNGVLSLTSYGGTNAAQLEAAIVENQ